VSANAEAASYAPLQGGTNNRIDYNNWENVYTKDASGAYVKEAPTAPGLLPDLHVGDVVHGVFEATDIANGPAGTPIPGTVPPGSVNGVFELQVVGFDLTGRVIFG